MVARKAKKKSKFDVSNELLAGLLIVAISLSVANFFTGSITGYGTNSQETDVSVEIEGVTAINWTTDTLDFGSGAVDDGYDEAVLDTYNGNVTDGNWSATSANLTLENVGGDYVNVTLESNLTANQLIGGTNPSIKWMISDEEPSSCGAIVDSAYTEVSITPGKEVCSPLYHNTTNNTMTVNFEVTIPIDATAGNKTFALTATGSTATQVS